MEISKSGLLVFSWELAVKDLPAHHWPLDSPAQFWYKWSGPQDSYKHLSSLWRADKVENHCCAHWLLPSQTGTVVKSSMSLKICKRLKWTEGRGRMGSSDFHKHPCGSRCCRVIWEHRLWNLASSNIRSVVLARKLKLSKHQFPHLWNWDNKSTSLLGLLWRQQRKIVHINDLICHF